MVLLIHVVEHVLEVLVGEALPGVLIPVIVLDTRAAPVDALKAEVCALVVDLACLVKRRLWKTPPAALDEALRTAAVAERTLLVAGAGLSVGAVRPNLGTAGLNKHTRGQQDRHGRGPRGQHRGAWRGCRYQD